MTATRHEDLWSVSLGQWGPIKVRLHAIFLLFCVFTVYLSWQASASESTSEMVWVGATALAVLGASVLVHELSHVYVARRQGRRCDTVVLWPFGGVARNLAGACPRQGLAEAIAGPAANLFICVACLPLLGLVANASVWELMHPLRPGDLTSYSILLEVVVKLMFWINWILFIINLIPAPPFDGGQALYCLIGIIWPKLTDRELRSIVGRAARLFAAGLLILAWAAHSPNLQGPVPTWLPLTLLAILVFFSARHYEQQGIDTEHRQEHANRQSLHEQPAPRQDELPDLSGVGEPLDEWLAERREAARRRRERVEADEEQRVDEILLRLHEVGLQNLSPDERRLLERVSERYRNRQENR